MHVILIAIGMHTKPYIASLAFTAFNWELLCNRDLILLLNKAFSAQNVMVQYNKFCPVFTNWSQMMTGRRLKLCMIVIIIAS